jgi:hypothetical protein
VAKATGANTLNSMARSWRSSTGLSITMFRTSAKSLGWDRFFETWFRPVGCRINFTLQFRTNFRPENSRQDVYVYVVLFCCTYMYLLCNFGLKTWVLRHKKVVKIGFNGTRGPKTDNLKLKFNILILSVCNIQPKLFYKIDSCKQSDGGTLGRWK